MWGLYLHIPFCPTRCIYCDFYSQSDLSLQSAFVEALCRELTIYHDREQWATAPRTIYLGGGTPSSLPLPLLERLMQHIRSLWPLDETIEITLEANPEDVSPEWADGVAQLGFNRISLGVQSFSEETLRFLQRRHSATQAELAISYIRQAGISNVSIDLIFALPKGYEQHWSESLAHALTLPATHLSAYGLTYERGTRLDRMRERGVVSPSSEETYVEQYYTLVAACQEAGFTHYELSNWGLPGFASQHNSAYWDGTPYLGLGPSAHSYMAGHRWWNLSDIHLYIERLQQDTLPIADEEWLTQTELYEECIMLGLRTSCGIDLRRPMLQGAPLMERATPWIKQGLLTHTADDHLRLTHEGLVWCDRICAALC
ncbi:MAG: radical SAM family heme chaperone HemW [Porphyromonas sp.]|uniref:radical SAM family heme chaperone HemW n=1 Tax=Porphyromonas sp. TaxID=1924944 RepID=UPI002A760AE3|nr:radical SAM family heme chaperone HemW [Porphyromonas sp.]MDD6928854.1 radical SAM family heme chaperone HemW [Bacteroidales bacterium]MDY3111235.1 radical SAM family heme chaperone HemW [Porphyromonas sp.]MDY4246311.1 radical SAM family heme chaperone HemW [Porphyromonas sp.]